MSSRLSRPPIAGTVSYRPGDRVDLESRQWLHCVVQLKSTAQHIHAAARFGQQQCPNVASPVPFSGTPLEAAGPEASSVPPCSARAPRPSQMAGYMRQERFATPPLRNTLGHFKCGWSPSKKGLRDDPIRTRRSGTLRRERPEVNSEVGASRTGN